MNEEKKKLVAACRSLAGEAVEALASVGVSVCPAPGDFTLVINSKEAFIFDAEEDTRLYIEGPEFKEALTDALTGILKKQIKESR